MSKIGVSDQLGMASVCRVCSLLCHLGAFVWQILPFFLSSENQHFMTKWESTAVLFPFLKKLHKNLEATSVMG